MPCSCEATLPDPDSSTTPVAVSRSGADIRSAGITADGNARSGAWHAAYLASVERRRRRFLAEGLTPDAMPDAGSPARYLSPPVAASTSALSAATSALVATAAATAGLRGEVLPAPPRPVTESDLDSQTDFIFQWTHPSIEAGEGVSNGPVELTPQAIIDYPGACASY